ncbi:uncharacterized protein LOC115480707 isoform X1 [Microcaecilia unicolor]|uniref:Uncharacterized protein LOC115480707 isoform X1 n=1 Tax=Microcaecilia unicolor TaxID=1415580 RepID=A0A6P7ZGC2_9AMPH|nr:uncharacterized protein LOC115480707 isoform X1 [Microcaecilia unicolor]
MRLLQIVLFSVLLCISDAQSRKPVLSPPVLSVKLGETAIFNCDVEFKDGWSTAFFQQIPGEAPKLLLHHYYTYKAPVYGPGVSAAHFTATVNSARTAYQLHISKAEVTDTALYHCLDWPGGTLSVPLHSLCGVLFFLPFPGPSGTLLPLCPPRLVLKLSPALAEGGLQWLYFAPKLDVQSQTPVLSPPVLFVRVGQSVTFNCDVGVKDGFGIYFSRHIPVPPVSLSL